MVSHRPPSFALLLSLLITLPGAGAEKSASSETDKATQFVLQCGHTDYVDTVIASPQGDTYVTRDANGVMKLWTCSRHELLWTAQVGSGLLLYSPDGKEFLALRSSSRGWQVWNVQSGAIAGQSDEDVKAVAFLPDGHQIIGVDHNGTSKIFDTSGNLLSSTKQEANNSISLDNWALSPDGHLLATDSRGQTPVVLCSTSPLAVKYQLPILGDVRISTVDFSPDSRLVAVGVVEDRKQSGSRGLIKIFDTQTGVQQRELVAYSGTGSNTRIEKVKFSPDGRSVLTLGENDNGGSNEEQDLVKVWEASTGTLLHHFANRDPGAPLVLYRGQASWVSDSRIIITSKDSHRFDYGVEEINLNTDKRQKFLWKRPVKLSQPSWSPDGRFLVASGFASPVEEGYSPMTVGQTVSAASTLRVWDRESGQWLTPPWGKEPTVTTITSPTPGVQGSLSYNMALDSGANISHWCWTPDSRNLITDRQDYVGHQLELWRWSPELKENTLLPISPPLTPNLGTQQLAPREQAALKSLTNLSGETKALETSPDNRTVAIGTVNESLRSASASDPGPRGSLAFWDTQNATLTHLEDGPDVQWLSFSPDGRWLAVGESYYVPSTAFISRKRQKRLDIWDVKARKKVATQDMHGKFAVGWFDNRNFMFTERVTSANGSTTNVLKKWDGNMTASIPVAVSSAPGKQGLGPGEEAIEIHGGLLLSRDDKEYHWYSLPNLKEVCALPVTGDLSQILSPDTNTAAVETPEGRIELWRPARDSKQARLAGTLALLSSPVGQPPGWFLWTPDGFYDCSPDASQWITFRQNGRLLSADVFALRRRPGLLREIAPLPTDAN